MTTPQEHSPATGVAQTLAPGLRRIIADNPGPMTHTGTNTYLVGTGEIAVIDPGPRDDTHLRAILDACRTGRIARIIVTHTHLDHSPLARVLSDATGAPVLAFGTATAGRSAVMDTLVREGFQSGGEGIDIDFEPDDTLADGDVIAGDGWALEVLHTPGHLGNHICLAWGQRCFTADHVMGWASSLVSPPDGDLTDFMASCAKLRARPWDVFYPGHGAPVTAPADRLDWLVAHRMGREAAILTALDDGPQTAEMLARTIYTDTAEALLPAAARNVLAHLIDLTGKSRVAPVGTLRADARFARL